MAIATVAETRTEEPDLVGDSLRIRDALAEDRAAAWCLQRAAFNIPDGDPPPHPGHRNAVRVAERDGRVVSCLTLIYADLYLRGTRFSMGGLRHVATHPEEQNRGYASALIRDTLHAMRSQGVLASVLFPFSFRYYRKFGYELGGNHCHFWCRPSCIPSYQERTACRVAVPEEAAGLAAFYRRRAEGSACAMGRDASRWSDICSSSDFSTVVHGGGVPEGYAVVAETRDSYGGRLLKVLELSAETPRAWRGLLGYLAQSPVESVEWLACAAELTASGLLRSTAPLREGFKPRGIATIRPMFQFRVVNVEGALRALSGRFPEGVYRLGLRIRDDLVSDNQRPVTIHGLGDSAEIRPARPTDPYLDMDIRVFSQILSGYMSPCEAVSQELARCSSPAALDVAEQLFPAGDPFISELDRF